MHTLQWLHRYHRLEHAGTPVYVDPLVPDWFVPSTATDRLLQAAAAAADPSAAVAACLREHGGDADQLTRNLHRLACLLQRPAPMPYQGRSHHLRMGRLREIWFHLTDTCNLACRHCLFAASPAKKATLARDRLLTAIDQAAGLGCHLFCFTGGEPFVYPDFCRILARIQELDSAHHLVILTNGMLLKEHLEQLQGLDSRRLHLQVSLDGLAPVHDGLRGRGSFEAVCANVRAAAGAGLAVTLSTAVNSSNLDQLEDIARRARDLGATGLHLMYHFSRGKGTDEQFVPPERIFQAMVRTARVCESLGLVLDNIEILRAQAFSVPGTRFDLSNMGWESLAVGPDSIIYPSPALVGIDQLACGSLDQGLETVWRQSAPLDRVRRSSVVDDPQLLRRPLTLITGGGDPDHSWVRGGTLVGSDPYLELYELLVLDLITRQACCYPDRGLLRLRMGEVRFDCPDSDNGSDGSVALTHCNCLVSLAGSDGHGSVREFYGAAARQENEEIVNPFAPDRGLTSFIPEEATRKSYGCGSPVRDAAPQAGETVVDLGSGSGVECFLAAEAVGAGGRVFGIDMTDDMLELARKSKKAVVERLGYDNIEFRKGFLEDIPLEDGCADVVISNCVINLSPDKRRTCLEILRILKPGGRLVVADVVTDRPLPPLIRNNDRYRGECLGGAMQQDDLVAMLEDCGYSAIYIHRRHPYRQVQGHRFFSLTYEAVKTAAPTAEEARVFYRGPLPYLATDAGLRLERGRRVRVAAGLARTLGELVFVLDEEGAVVNVEQEACCCSTAPEDAPDKETAAVSPVIPIRRHRSGCMVCGAELVYGNEAEERNCHFCGTREKTNTGCRKGHFICDTCHQQEGIKVIRHICLTTREKDMITLLTTIRSHPGVPMHGPEHHAMVPGIILAACRNSGGEVSREMIAAGIERGSSVPGGACGFWGSCGAAIGAGIAAALILDATPLTPNPRQQAQEFTARILADIAQVTGGRCCQRETWLALTHTAHLSEEFFGIPMSAGALLHCDQYRKNRECIRRQCPLWDLRATGRSGVRLTVLGN